LTFCDSLEGGDPIKRETGWQNRRAHGRMNATPTARTSSRHKKTGFPPARE
jgi:hypothetical protein